MLETKPMLQGSGCPTTGMVPHVSLCTLIIFFNRHGIKEGFTGKGEDDHNGSNLSIQTMVSNPTENEYKEPFTSVELNRLTKKSTRGVTPSDQCKKIEASCMAGFRQQLERGLSGRASVLVINTRSKDIQKNYKSAWDK